MSKTSKVGGVLVTAAVAFAVYKYMQLEKEEKKELLDSIKEKTSDIINNSEEALNKVQKYMTDLKEKEEDEILEKIIIFKNMIFDVFKSKSKQVENYKNDLSSGIN